MSRFIDPRIERAREALNTVSTEIMELEDYLLGSAVRTPVFVPLFVEGISTGEHIGWDLGEPKRWRIVYTDAAGDRHILIETKWEVRRRAYEHLDALLKAAGDSLESVR